MQGEVVGECE
ncbi:Protein of unknown function [Bacillus mycoides]|nr:Protein of unknown function [Bacillus mycoides]